MRSYPFLWRSYFVSLCVFVPTLFAFNYVVDPLGYNYRFLFTGVNSVKPSAIGYERELKPHRISQVQPRTLILGSSRAVYGIDPERLTGLPTPVYNAAMEYGQLYEFRYNLEYAKQVAPIQEVVLFLHYFNFGHDKGVKGFELDAFDSDSVSQLRRYGLAYFSADALIGIFDTLFYNLFVRRVIGVTHTGYITYGSEPYYLNHSPEKRRDLVSDEAGILVDYQVGLHIVRQIRDFCAQHGIQLHAIVGPYPPEHVQMRRELGNWDEVVAWKSALRNVIPFADYYHESSPFGARDFYDRVHFTAEAGIRMVNALKTRTDFPVR